MDSGGEEDRDRFKGVELHVHVSWFVVVLGASEVQDCKTSWLVLKWLASFFVLSVC